jgi:hypothetical protein
MSHSLLVYAYLNIKGTPLYQLFILQVDAVITKL